MGWIIVTALITYMAKDKIDQFITFMFGSSKKCTTQTQESIQKKPEKPFNIHELDAFFVAYYNKEVVTFNKKEDEIFSIEINPVFNPWDECYKPSKLLVYISSIGKWFQGVYNYGEAKRGKFHGVFSKVEYDFLLKLINHWGIEDAARHLQQIETLNKDL